jgi:hypothetical protein
VTQMESGDKVPSRAMVKQSRMLMSSIGPVMEHKKQSMTRVARTTSVGKKGMKVRLTVLFDADQ